MQLRELNQSQGVVQSLSSQRSKKTELGVEFSNILSSKQMEAPKAKALEKKLNTNNTHRDKSIQTKKNAEVNESTEVKNEPSNEVKDEAVKTDKTSNKEQKTSEAPDTKEAKKAMKAIIRALKKEGVEVDEETLEAVVNLLSNQEIVDLPEMKELMTQLQNLMEMLSLESQVGMNLENSTTPEQVLETITQMVETMSGLTEVPKELKEEMTNLAEMLDKVEPESFQKVLEGLTSDKSNDLSTKGEVDQAINKLFEQAKVDQTSKQTEVTTEKTSKVEMPKIVVKGEETQVESNVSEDLSAMMQVEGKNTLITSAQQVQQLQASPQLERNIVNQVMEVMKAEISTTEDVQTMIVRLKPQELGNVELRVSLDKGVVLAEMQVENEIVKAAVESNLSFLKDTLQEKGIELDKFNVNINSGFQSESGEQQGGHAQKQSSRFRGFVESNDESMEELLVPDQGNENINIRV